MTPFWFRRPGLFIASPSSRENGTTNWMHGRLYTTEDHGGPVSYSNCATDAMGEEVQSPLKSYNPSIILSTPGQWSSSSPRRFTSPMDVNCDFGGDGHEGKKRKIKSVQSVLYSPWCPDTPPLFSHSTAGPESGKKWNTGEGFVDHMRAFVRARLEVGGIHL